MVESRTTSPDRPQKTSQPGTSRGGGQPDRAQLEQTDYSDACIRRMNAEDSLLILTHQKAGTHYLRFLFANYLQQMEAPGSAPVSYAELQKRMPNRRDFVLKGLKPVADGKDFTLFGIREVMFGHVADKVARANDHHHLGRKVICVRNPLDFLISIWHYNYLQRRSPERSNQSIDDVLSKEISKYSAQMKYLKEVAQSTPERTFMTSYEALQIDPASEFSGALRLCGIEVKEDLLVAAVRNSSFKEIRRQEDERGRAIVAPISGRFTRDGSIGQWKSHLTDEHITKISEILAEQGLSLDDYILEDPR